MDFKVRKILFPIINVRSRIILIWLQRRETVLMCMWKIREMRKLHVYKRFFNLLLRNNINEKNCFHRIIENMPEITRIYFDKQNLCIIITIIILLLLFSPLLRLNKNVRYLYFVICVINFQKGNYKLLTKKKKKEIYILFFTLTRFLKS